MLLRLLLMISLWAPLAAGAAPTILVLGDSLSAAYGLDQSDGWVNLLQQRLEQAGYRQRVANASISGETTRGALSRLAAELERHDPSIVLIELGGNDGLRGLPADTTRKNLQAIIDRTRGEYPDVKIVLAGMKVPPNMGRDYGRQFDAIFPELAKKNKAALIPFVLEGVGGVRELNLPDGIHPTAKGHEIIANNVWRVLEPVLRSLNK
jgi:acyl-CoA thioesterase-1